MTATAAVFPAAPPATGPELRSGRPIPLPAALAATTGAGVALLLAFPPYDLWWLAPPAVALLAVAVHRRRARAGAGLGLLAGLALFVPLLSWAAVHIALPPWLLLAGLQASYVALLGAAAAYASPLVDRHRWLWPVLTALLWVGQEALRSRTPFGGFPWGRLAFGQSDSPLLRLAAAGGAPLVTFGVALAGGLLAAAGWVLFERRAVAAAGLALGAAAVVLAGSAVPLARTAGAGGADRADGAPVSVAIVQGNVPRMGLDFNSQRRAVLDNHVNETLALAERVAAGELARPDLVVWPENSSDIDPLVNADARARIDQAARAIGVPILVGAVLVGPEPGALRNAGVVWQPEGGPGEIYVKRHPVPFGEYMPLRPVFAPIARLVAAEADLLRSDFTAGDRPGVLRVGPAVLGDVICFEVAYDDLVRDTVTAGAELLVVQTNNATFNVAEARQQLAMVRLRAVEHGRDAMMASTVGVSGFVTADGAVHRATGFNTRALVVHTVHTATGRTLASRLGPGLELALAALALAALVAAHLLRRRRPGPNPAGRAAGARTDTTDADTTEADTINTGDSRAGIPVARKAAASDDVEDV